MRLLVCLGIFVGLYAYFLMSVTDAVIRQTESLSVTYQYVADNAEHIAAGD